MRRRGSRMAARHRATGRPVPEGAGRDSGPVPPGAELASERRTADADGAQPAASASLAFEAAAASAAPGAPRPPMPTEGLYP